MKDEKKNRKQPTKSIIVKWVIISIIFAFIIHLLFSLPAPSDFFVAKWSAGELLAYACTVSLGLLALWQNYMLQDENKQSQEKLEKLADESNKLALICKIVEYETENLSRMRIAIDDFTEACSATSYLELLEKNKNSVQKSIVRSNARSNLDRCFFNLTRELRLDPNCKVEEANPINQCTADCYYLTKEMIDGLEKNDVQKVETTLKALKTRRNEFMNQRELLLTQKEQLIDNILYNNLTIEEIKKIQKRDSKLTEENENG